MGLILITIETDNTAFDRDVPGERPEAKRILQELAQRFMLRVNVDPTRVNDVNGNTVCDVVVTD